MGADTHTDDARPIGSTDLAKLLLRISACALATACLALLWAWCMRVATVWCASVSVLLGLALVQVAAIAAFVLAWYADLQGNAIIGGSSSMAAAATESLMLMTVLAASPSTCVIVGAVAQSAVVVALVLLLLQRRSWRLSLSMLALELRAFDRPHAGTTRLLVASMLAFYVTWFCLWALTVLLAQQAWSVWRPAVFIIYTLCALNWYWTTQVCKNVLRVAIGALQARHYLALEDSEAERHPIRFAFSRAFGPHFASICLGSLLLPPNELVCQSLSVVTAAVGCGHTLKAMVIGPFARLANKFSLHYLAIYGSPFLRAANSVWLQLSRTGVGTCQEPERERESAPSPQAREHLRDSHICWKHRHDPPRPAGGRRTLGVGRGTELRDACRMQCAVAGAVRTAGVLARAGAGGLGRHGSELDHVRRHRRVAELLPRVLLRDASADTTLGTAVVRYASRQVPDAVSAAVSRCGVMASEYLLVQLCPHENRM